MTSTPRIYVIGAGSIGMPLAAFLSAKGTPVTAVRSSIGGVAPTTIAVTVDLPDGQSLKAHVETVSLSEIKGVDDGLVAFTAKATVNKAIAMELKHRFANLPLVVMQNGIGVEKPFVDAGFSNVYRCIVYATGQTIREHRYSFREVTDSPLGVMKAAIEETRSIVDRLSTSNFRFRCEENIERQAWKKAILNAAFNSICPLIDIDNGIFHRDDAVAAIAATVIEEACTVAARLGIRFEARELIDQLLLISRRADGQLISTLQDLNNGKETEIDFLNMQIASVGAALEPPIDAQITRVLGEMVLAKSRILRRESTVGSDDERT